MSEDVDGIGAILIKLSERCVLLILLMLSGCEEKPDSHWARHVVARGYITHTAIAADFTGDGLPDVIVNGKNGRTLLYVAPDWRAIIIAPPPKRAFHPRNATHSEVMDVDGDGDLDYIAAYFDPGEIFWLERPADPLKGPWPHRLIDDQIYGVHGLMVGDIDGDGKPDLVANSSLPKGSFPESLLWYKVPPDRGKLLSGTASCSLIAMLPD
jgi:FG-GAP-like repeat